MEIEAEERTTPVRDSYSWAGHSLLRQYAIVISFVVSSTFSSASKFLDKYCCCHHPNLIIITSEVNIWAVGWPIMLLDWIGLDSVSSKYDFLAAIIVEIFCQTGQRWELLIIIARQVIIQTAVGWSNDAFGHNWRYEHSQASWSHQYANERSFQLLDSYLATIPFTHLQAEI